VLKLLLNAEELEVVPEYEAKKGTLTVKTPMGELYLPTEGLIDVAAEKNRLQKELEKIQAEIAKVEQKLSNPAFTQKVPREVLAEHQKRLVDWQEKLAHVRKALDILNS
jgi:valyl-tRNA synthetase